MVIMLPYTSYEEAGTAYACLNGSCLTAAWYPAICRALLVSEVCKSSYRHIIGLTEHGQHPKLVIQTEPRVGCATRNALRRHPEL